jgi:Sec-independent protein secretion pathway component TatC
MALPLHLLYEISILISWYWDWRDRRSVAAASRPPGPS